MQWKTQSFFSLILIVHTVSIAAALTSAFLFFLIILKRYHFQAKNEEEGIKIGLGWGGGDNTRIIRTNA